MSKIYYLSSIKFDILNRIKQLPDNIILRSDIKDIASPRQISRSLRALVEMGELVKIGYGVYAKSYLSKYVNKAIIKNGFGIACKEALIKLGISWEPGWAEKAYNAGESTQVPVRTMIRLRSRFRRKLADGNYKLLIENNKNAR